MRLLVALKKDGLKITAFEVLTRTTRAGEVGKRKSLFDDSLALLPASRAHHCFRIMSVANRAHAIRCCTIPASVFGSGRRATHAG